MNALLQIHAFVSQPQVYLPVIGVALLALLIARKPATALYVGLIPLINWSFAHVPTIPTDDLWSAVAALSPALEWAGHLRDGGVFQPLAIVTGLVLVVRDFAQRELGHGVFGAMALGLVFSAMTTPPAIVLASGIAFLVSETADWAVYTFTKRPLSQRILVSSIAGAPIDTAIFLFGANMVTPGVFAWSTAITSIVSKLVGAVIVSRLVAAREAREGAKA